MHTHMPLIWAALTTELFLGWGFCVFAMNSSFVLGLIILCLVYFLFVVVLVVSPSAVNCLENLVSEMTCYVWSGDVKPYTLTHLIHAKCSPMRGQAALEKSWAISWPNGT